MQSWSWAPNCNGYRIWINKTKHSGLDLILFIGLCESWRASPESWHLSREYNTPVNTQIRSVLKGVWLARGKHPQPHFTIKSPAYKPLEYKPPTYKEGGIIQPPATPTSAPPEVLSPVVHRVSATSPRTGMASGKLPTRMSRPCSPAGFYFLIPK